MTADVVDLTRCCLAGGWRLVIDSTIPSVAPCAVHRADQHTRWAAGEFEPRRPVEVEWHGRLALVR